MVKYSAILALLLIAVSAVLGLIEVGNAIALAIAGAVLIYASREKANAWCALALCVLSSGAMAAGMSDGAIGILESIYNATAQWAGWTTVGLLLGVVHTVALLWVNLTETPDDDNRYGRIYKRVIEPLAGILNGGKAKQLPFSKRW